MSEIQTKFYLNSVWRYSSSRTYYDDINPYNNEVK